MKSLSKNTIFIQKMLVADVVTAKYIEEAQPLKLQLHKWTKKINFNPQKATTCISERNQFWLHKLSASGEINM